MAKNGFKYPELVRVVKDNNLSPGWTLCIGAGVSNTVFPTWNELVRRLIARQHPAAEASELTKMLLKQFAPDAIVQAAQERSALSDDDFSQALIDELYADVRDKLDADEWDVFLEGLSRVIASQLYPTLVRSFLSLFDRHFSTCTSLQIAGVIAESIDTGSRPQSILSFNAERMLFALTSMTIVNQRLTADRDPVKAGVYKQRIDLVTHSTSTRSTNRIQYYMCHGALPLPNNLRPKSRESIDKLVFSESNYLQLANANFSWQSTVFTDCAISRPIIFVGMSMSDPNVRRWLGWAHTNRSRELQRLGAWNGSSTLHYWIRRDVYSQEEKTWIESSVAHLGIRLVWIPSWDQVGNALRVMVGLKPPLKNQHNASARIS